VKLPRAMVSWLACEAIRIAFSRPPDRLIGTQTDVYMKRWYVIPRNKIFNIYLHHFLRSDDDRALHDHPWWNCSILIAGKYTEHTIAAGGVHTRTEYVAGDIKLRGAAYAHRIELTVGPCWTMFITGPLFRAWGFHCPNGWRPSKEFVDAGNPDKIGRGCD
jgi:hypothetical protein